MSECTDSVQDHFFIIEDADEMIKKIDSKSDPLDILSYIIKRWNRNENKKIFNELDASKEEVIKLLKHCPSTTIIVERLFSMLGKELTNYRHFKKENIST